MKDVKRKRKQQYQIKIRDEIYKKVWVDTLKLLREGGERKKAEYQAKNVLVMAKKAARQAYKNYLVQYQKIGSNLFLTFNFIIIKRDNLEAPNQTTPQPSPQLENCRDDVDPPANPYE